MVIRKQVLMIRRELLLKSLIALLVFAVLILLIITLRGSSDKQRNDIHVCSEEFSNEECTGLEIVKPALGQVCRDNIYPVTQAEYRTDDLRNIYQCIEEFPSNLENSYNKSWTSSLETSHNTSRINSDIRHKHHTYLNSNSRMIEIGGNNGSDTLEFLKLYHPSVYVILEPNRLLCTDLKLRFKARNVFIYNIGVGRRNERISMVGNPTCNNWIVNATEFFIRLGVGCHEYDLITIDCEGCEYDLLEVMLSTNLIKYFKNIQFRTYSKFSADPVKRYCKMITRLAKTHNLSYIYKFQWQNWIRKNSKSS